MGVIKPSNLDTKIKEVARHIHNKEYWIGKRASQTATEWGTVDSITPFRAISGANTWGSDANDEAQVLGTADTPIETGHVYFDAHRIVFDAVSNVHLFKIRGVWGLGTLADAITAGQYSDILVKFEDKKSGTPNAIKSIRIPCGYKLWVQAWCAIDNGYVDFLLGIHEYCE